MIKVFVKNNKKYTFDCTLTNDKDGKYRFHIQGWNLRNSIEETYVFNTSISSQTVSKLFDEMPKSNVLEKIVMQVFEDHFNEVLSQKPNQVIGGIDIWFEEAKRKYDI